jgi:hypothetical protein
MGFEAFPAMLSTFGAVRLGHDRKGVFFDEVRNMKDIESRGSLDQKN